MQTHEEDDKADKNTDLSARILDRLCPWRPRALAGITPNTPTKEERTGNKVMTVQSSFVESSQENPKKKLELRKMMDLRQRKCKK